MIQLKYANKWTRLHFTCFLQVFCVSDFFTQPVNPVVAQEEEEEAQQTNPQDHSSNGNHYGTTD